MTKFVIHDVPTSQEIGFYELGLLFSVIPIDFSQISQIDSTAITSDMTQKDRKHRHFCSTRARKRLSTTHNNQNTHQQNSDSEARKHSPPKKRAL